MTETSDRAELIRQIPNDYWEGKTQQEIDAIPIEQLRQIVERIRQRLADY